MNKLISVSPIEEKGEWLFRTLKISTQDEEGKDVELEGDWWHKDKEVLLEADALVGLEVDFFFAAGVNGKSNKLKVWAVDPNKKVKSSDEKDYWKRREEREEKKFDYDIRRTSVNDKKLELQSIREHLVPFYVEAFKTSKKLLPEDFIDLMVKKSVEIFKQHNPENAD